MDKPIRVLCVMSTLDRGGAETMVMNLFRNTDKESVVFDFVKHSNAYISKAKELFGYDPD